MNTSWYALQVRTGHELEIASNVERFAEIKKLSSFVHEVFAGVKKVVRMTEKGRKLGADSVLTGYIFVKLDTLSAELWHFLKNVPGVLRILDMLPISTEQIEHLYNQCKGEVEVSLDEEVVQKVQETQENEVQYEQMEEAVQMASTMDVPSQESLTSLFEDNKEIKQNYSIVELLNMLGSYRKGKKVAFRIPLWFYRKIVNFDTSLEQRRNETNMLYIIDSIRRYLSSMKIEKQFSN